MHCLQLRGQARHVWLTREEKMLQYEQVVLKPEYTEGWQYRQLFKEQGKHCWTLRVVSYPLKKAGAHWMQFIPVGD